MSILLYTQTKVIKGLTATIEYHYDADADAPWQSRDGHGPVRSSLKHHSPHHSDKRPGESPLNSPERHETQYYYDWQEAMKIAQRDGWGPGTTAEAVQADFDYLRGYIRGDWQYVGIVVRITDPQGLTLAMDDLWGVETFKDYHETEAREMAEQLIEHHLQKLEAEANEARILRRYRDAQDLLPA